MSNVLYRQYRAKSFAEIKGQPVVIGILTQAITNNSIAHAYLFSGARGTGKTSTARIFAKAVNCENFTKTGDVCNDCVYCRSIENSESMDVIEIDAASNRGIEEIRMLRDSIEFLPTNNKFKVYIVDEVHMLTREAFNALLKTLEEPPQHVIFILATTEAHKVPSTILSRVQRMDFKLASIDELREKISMILTSEGLSIDDNALEILYKYSGGSYRDAESILGKLMLASKGENIITGSVVSEVLGISYDSGLEDIMQTILADDLNSALNVIKSIKEQNIDPAHFMQALATRMKDECLANAEGGLIYQKLIKLLTSFVSILKEMRNIDDKFLLLELWIMSSLSLNEKKEILAKKVDTSNKITQTLEDTQDSIQQTIRAESSETILSKGEQIVDLGKVLDILKTKDIKIWATLKACKLNVYEDSMEILCPFDYGEKLLSENSAISKIKEALIQVGANNIATINTIRANLGEGSIESLESNIDMVESLL